MVVVMLIQWQSALKRKCTCIQQTALKIRLCACWDGYGQIWCADLQNCRIRCFTVNCWSALAWQTQRLPSSREHDVFLFIIFPARIYTGTTSAAIGNKLMPHWPYLRDVHVITCPMDWWRSCMCLWLLREPPCINHMLTVLPDDHPAAHNMCCEQAAAGDGLSTMFFTCLLIHVCIILT